jgi:tellurite resistance protein TehA-like permease
MTTRRQEDSEADNHRWAMVFPNTGFTIAVTDIGNALESQGIKWVGSIMSILIFIMWLFVICSHIHAVATRKIMMHGQDEDVGED